MYEQQVLALDAGRIKHAAVNLAFIHQLVSCLPGAAAHTPILKYFVYSPPVHQA
jgi:hypothetical protein